MAKPALPYETQHQRWIKYGANVVLSVVLVSVVSVLIVVIAQRVGGRIDTTKAKAYSLKRQTLGIIRDVKSPVRIVSLYSRPTGTAQQQQTKQETDYAQVVEDLLNEYKRAGKNIEVESIDPVADVAKADALYEYVRNRYGGELAKYKEFFDAYPPQFEAIKKVALDEVERMKSVPDNAGDPQLSETIKLTRSSLADVATLLDDTKTRVDRVLKQKRPDYKAAADIVT